MLPVLSSLLLQKDHVMPGRVPDLPPIIHTWCLCPLWWEEWPQGVHPLVTGTWEQVTLCGKTASAGVVKAVNLEMES